MLYRAIGVLWLVGCYTPHPAEGTPCTTSAECPAPLACYTGHCQAEPDPIDAAIPADGSIAPDVAPVTGCPDNANECDGFEHGLSDWALSISSTGTIVTSSEVVHSGASAIDATVPASATNGQSAYAAHPFSVVQSTGVLAARAFIFAPAPIVDFAGVMQFRHGQDQYAAVSGDSGGKWALTERSTAGGLVDHHSTAPAIDQQWLCVELDYTFAPAHVKLYIDDVLVLDVDVTDPAPSFTEVGIGVTRATATGYRVFVDDAVIAPTHIGCKF